MAWEDAPEEVRWYAGGAFDGDGCVHITSRHLRPRLVITQAERGRMLLDHFQALCGGAIYAGPRPRDMEKHQRTWAWCLTGMAAALMCSKLAPYTHLKRSQLELAAAFQKTMNQTSKKELASQIASLKKQPHMPIHAVPLHHAYAAGIVDTDGSLRAFPSVGLSVTQKYPAVLEALRQTYGIGSVTGPKWQVSGTKAKEVLRHVQPFLVAKKPQADIVLQAKLTGDIDAKIALMPLQGNQGPRRHNRAAAGLSKLNVRCF